METQPSATQPGQETTTLMGPDGHIFTVGIPVAADTVPSPTDAKMADIPYILPTALDTAPTENHSEDHADTAPDPFEDDLSFPETEDDSRKRKLVLVGALATVATLGVLSHKTGVSVSESASSASVAGTLSKIPLIRRSRRLKIAALGRDLGGQQGKRLSKTSNDRMDTLRKIHYDRITPNLSGIPTKEVEVRMYDSVTGEYTGTEYRTVANGGARGVERLTGRTGTDRSRNSVRVDQHTKAANNVAGRISPTQTVASSGKELRLERRLATANGKIAKMDSEIEDFTMLYGEVLKDSEALARYIAETPMSREERRDLLDAAVKVRHATHVKHHLLKKHYSDFLPEDDGHGHH